MTVLIILLLFWAASIAATIALWLQVMKHERTNLKIKEILEQEPKPDENPDFFTP